MLHVEGCSPGCGRSLLVKYVKDTTLIIHATRYSESIQIETVEMALKISLAFHI